MIDKYASRGVGVFFSCLICCLVYSPERALAAGRGQPADPTCGGVVTNPSIQTAQDFYNIVDYDYFGLVERRHLTALEAQYKAGRWEPAFGELSYVLNKIPNHPHALYRLVQLHGLYREATRNHVEDKLRCAVYWNEEHPGSRIIYGLFFHRAGEYEKAIEQYEIALKLNPNHGEAHYNLGLSLFKLGQYEGASDHAQAAKKAGYPLFGLQGMLERRQSTQK